MCTSDGLIDRKWSGGWGWVVGIDANTEPMVIGDDRSPVGETHDLDNLIVDLSHDIRETTMCDDGLLSSSCGKNSLCYSSREHHPLTGHEESLIRCGFPITRIDLGSFKDSELLQLA